MQVFVLEYSHKHGEDLNAHATQAGADAAIAAIVREYWAEEMRGEDGVPATPDDLSDADAVRVYFEHTDESYEIHELHVHS